jgi:hypothetical protein
MLRKESKWGVTVTCLSRALVWRLGCCAWHSFRVVEPMECGALWKQVYHWRMGLEIPRSVQFELFFASWSPKGGSYNQAFPIRVEWISSNRTNLFFFFFFFQDRVSLCSPRCPGTHSVDQAGLELRNPPASASRVLGLKACTTTPGQTEQILTLQRV